MERGLVVVDRHEGIEGFVAEAGRLAAGVDAELVLVNVISEADFEEDRRAMADALAFESTQYSLEQAIGSARQFASKIARSALDDLAVEYDVVGAVGDVHDEVLALAADRDCDHVFIVGRRRSPSGKAIFGDTAQQIILNFPGPVTITTRPIEAT